MPEIFSSYLYNAKNAFPVQALRNVVYSIWPEQDEAEQSNAGQNKAGQVRAKSEKKDQAKSRAGRQRLVTICGKSGSGKTMLLSAISDYLGNSGQDCQILFEKASRWLASQDEQENRQTVPDSKLPGQKKQVLLLDDLQDIQAGDQATSCLCAILDSLDIQARQDFTGKPASVKMNGEISGLSVENSGQSTQPGIPELVILAYCGPATGLASLGQRLQTRLCQGLVLELHDPDLDVRLRYAENLAKKQKIALERGQLVHIARYCGNIPAVAGVMTRVVAYLEAGFSFTDQTGLEKLVQNGGQAVMPGCRDIVHEVARLTDTRPAEIIGRSRKAEVVLARQLSLLVCRRLLGLSYMELGREFGGRDHSTVMHAIEKFHRAAISDKRMNNLVTEVENSLKLRTENLAGRFSMFVA